MAMRVRAPLALVPCCHTTKHWKNWRERGLACPFPETATAMLHPRAVDAPPARGGGEGGCGRGEGVEGLMQHLARLEERVAWRVKGKVRCTYTCVLMYNVHMCPRTA